MNLRQIERESEAPNCTCDNVCNRGHHHRLCKAWRPKVTVTKRYESGFRLKKRQERSLPTSECADALEAELAMLEAELAMLEAHVDDLDVELGKRLDPAEAMKKQPNAAHWSAEGERARRARDEIVNIDDVKQLKWLAECVARQLKKNENKR